MNIEAYNLDSLRKLVRSLQDENKRLKVLLDKADIAYELENVITDGNLTQSGMRDIRKHHRVCKEEPVGYISCSD